MGIAGLAQGGIGKAAQGAVIQIIGLGDLATGNGLHLGQGDGQQGIPQFRGETGHLAGGIGSSPGGKNAEAAPGLGPGGLAQGAGGLQHRGIDPGGGGPKRLQPRRQTVQPPIPQGQGGQQMIGRGQKRQGQGAQTPGRIAQDQVIALPYPVLLQCRRKGGTGRPAAQGVTPARHLQIRLQQGRRGRHHVKPGPQAGPDQISRAQGQGSGQHGVHRLGHLTPVKPPLVQPAQMTCGRPRDQRQDTCARGRPGIIPMPRRSGQVQAQRTRRIAVNHQDPVTRQRGPRRQMQQGRAAPHAAQGAGQGDKGCLGGAWRQIARLARSAGEMGAQGGKVGRAEPAGTALGPGGALGQAGGGGQNPAEMFRRHRQDPGGDFPDRNIPPIPRGQGVARRAGGGKALQVRWGQGGHPYVVCPIYHENIDISPKKCDFHIYRDVDAETQLPQPFFGCPSDRKMPLCLSLWL